MAYPTDAAVAPAQYNLMRQKLGAKGAATRQRILDSVVALVDIQTGEVPSITEICRLALISKATFYQYFEDFNAVVVELLGPVAQSTDELAAMLAEPWPEDEIYSRSHAFIGALFAEWERYRVPLRLRSLLADAGDKAMIESKLHSVDPMIRELARKICVARGGSRQRRDDHALAVALISGIGHAALILTHNAYSVAIDEAIGRLYGYPGEDQRRALAHMMATALRNPEIVGDKRPTG